MQKPVRTVIAALAIMSSQIPAAVAAAGSPRPLVRFEDIDRGALEAMRESGAWDIVEVDGTTVLAVEEPALVPPGLVPPGARRWIEKGDIDEVFAHFRAQGSEGAYHSVAEVEAELAEIAAAHPDTVELVEIGRSIEDRPLTAVRIGARDGVERPTAVFASMLHAREWITTEMGMALVHRLVEPGDDEALAEVLAATTVWVVPVVNPDGLIWSQSEYTWWRGNRRVHDNGRIGTDLNRNFPTGWGIGSSSWPGSQTYRGAEPLSEPEAAALNQLVEDVDPVLTMTFHAYGRMVLRPFGYKTGTPGREDLFSQYGELMKQQTGYATGPVSELIGRVGGATDDHFVEAHGAFALSLELGDSFIPAESLIPDIVEGAMPAALTWVKAIPALDGVDPRQPPTAPEAAFGALFP